MNKRGDIEPTAYVLLVVILAAGILLLLISVTQKMYPVNLSFG